MAQIIQVTVTDGVMRTTYDDGYFNEITIPAGYKIQVRIVPLSEKKRDLKHYKYAQCHSATRAISPIMVYSTHEVTCKTCRQAIKSGLLLN